ncbi:MAG: porin [Alphaproteobacteria bacterium]|nr:porin [Alphaproteobacteria bacterium]
MKITSRHKFNTSLLAIILSSSSLLANAGPASKDGKCCGALEESLRRLESKAVMSDTKKILISGQVNRSMLWLDNGNKSNMSHVDNFNSESRLNITGKANLNDDTIFGGVFELGFRSNTSDENDVKNSQSNATASKELIIRHADLFIDSVKFGKLSMGRGDMASNHTMEETDLSGTSVVANGSSVWAMASGASFYEKTSGTNRSYFVQAEDDTTFEGAFGSTDGLDRHDRVRYDTPKYYGVQLSTSHAHQGSGNLFDVAARFAGKFSGVKVAATAAFTRNESLNADTFADRYNHKQYSASLGVLLPFSMSRKEDTGISLMVSGLKRDWDARGQKNGSFYHGKIGYTDRYFSIGNTSVAVDLAQGKNTTRSLDSTNTFVDNNIQTKAKSWGVFLVQNVDVVASDLYAGYRRYSVKKSNSTLRFNDIHAVMAGARVKL